MNGNCIKFLQTDRMKGWKRDKHTYRKEEINGKELPQVVVEAESQTCSWEAGDPGEQMI
jgi:hypothetical protein